jgi:hypothetical protein
MRSATTAMISSPDAAVREAQWGRFARFVGVAIASIAPAVFWCVVIQLIAYWSGITLSPIAIGALFVTIAAFLFAVCAPLILRNPAAEDHVVHGTASARHARTDQALG